MSVHPNRDFPSGDTAPCSVYLICSAILMAFDVRTCVCARVCVCARESASAYVCACARVLNIVSLMCQYTVHFFVELSPYFIIVLLYFSRSYCAVIAM